MPTKENILIQRLLTLTKTQKLKWVPTAEEEKFMAVFSSKNAVTIRKSQSQAFDEGPDFTFSILDKEGTEILTINNGLEDVEYRHLATLHEAARRNALNIEKTLDEILADLPTGPGEKEQELEIRDEDIPF